MKKIISAVSLLLLSTSVFAWTIGPMNYQGRLLDGAGIPLTGTYTFNVRIYDALTAGTLKFSEQQSNIAVDDGVYSFLVSTGTTLSGTWDINLWNTPSLYLEIEVNGQTLAPRHLLAAAPFAFQANLALTTNNALALGGVSATQYQNTLAAICSSGKGKWLELVGKCLGIAASFPGPTTVSLNTLTASTDLTGLDLSKADISGIDFGNANFTGTVFKSTTLNAAGIKNTNMTNTVLDSIVTSGNGNFTANFTNATISNINMAGWDLSAAVLSGVSAADITACPSNLPAQYICRLIDGTTKYFIGGPNVNLSKNSLMNNRFDSVGLGGILYEMNLTGATFEGNKIKSQNVIDSNLSGANFKQAYILDSMFQHCNFAATSAFSESVIQNTSFQILGGSQMIFHDSRLDGVLITGEGTSSASFDTSILNNVQFSLYGANASLFLGEGTYVNALRVYAATAVLMEGATISGGVFFGDEVSGVLVFGGNYINGNFSGNWRNSSVDEAEGGSFVNASFYGADLTGSAGWGNAYTGGSLIFTNVNWLGAKCPDGHAVTTVGDTCINHFLP